MVLLAGCSDRPHAPALRDEPVYQNDAEGFRFLAPEGWAQFARANLPPGPVTKEKLLVGYRRRTGESPASFEVTCVDLPEGADLVAQAIGTPGGPHAWRAAGAPEPTTAGGAAATKFTLLGRPDREQLQRDVVAVRRGPRVYFFTLTAATKDAAARDAVRRVVSGVSWK